MKPLNIDNTLFPAVYASGLAKTIAAEQDKLGFMPDWWQQVVAQLYNQLDKRVADNTADTVNHYQGLIAKLKARIDDLEANQSRNPA